MYIFSQFYIILPFAMILNLVFSQNRFDNKSLIYFQLDKNQPTKHFVINLSILYSFALNMQLYV